MRELNDNIDHNNVAIIWIGLGLQIFFFGTCKENVVFTIFIIGFIFDHIFESKKNKLFSPVIIFHRGMSNAICDLVLYLQSEGLNISWIHPHTVPFQYSKTVFAIQIKHP